MLGNWGKSVRYVSYVISTSVPKTNILKEYIVTAEIVIIMGRRANTEYNMNNMISTYRHIRLHTCYTSTNFPINYIHPIDLETASFYTKHWIHKIDLWIQVRFSKYLTKRSHFYKIFLFNIMYLQWRVQSPSRTAKCHDSVHMVFVRVY